VIRFSTFDLQGGGYASAVSIISGNSGTSFYGNILENVPVLMRNWTGGAPIFFSDHNLLGDSFIGVLDGSTMLTLDEWMQSQGNPDAHSILGNPLFMDAAGGNFFLLPGSPGIDAFTPDQLEQIATDYFGSDRPSGSAFDIGAIEVPEPSSIGLLGLGIAALLRRRRKQNP
jgi:hypothetical protein